MKHFEVKKVHPNAKLPERGSEYSSGLDLYAAHFKKFYSATNLEYKTQLKDLQEIELLPLERVLVGTGLSSNFPVDMDMQIRPRSGMALKEGITVLNTPGTVDADYKDEIGVILVNLSPFPVKIKIGERIAQAVFIKVERLEPKWTDKLIGKNREGGFGHTGKK